MEAASTRNPRSECAHDRGAQSPWVTHSWSHDDLVKCFARAATLEEVRGRQDDFYRDLHGDPGLSHPGDPTAAKVTDRLRATGSK
jgi:hypothetical protein